MSTLLWVIVAALVVFWIIGYFFAHLGSLVWIALVVAVILVVYNLLMGGRAEI